MDAPINFMLCVILAARFGQFKIYHEGTCRVSQLLGIGRSTRI